MPIRIRAAVLRPALTVLVGLAVLATSAAAVAQAGGPRHGHSTNREVAVMRAVTARYHNIANAELDGYVLLQDVNGITCIDEPGMGGMGIHYVKPALIADPAINPRTPEALVYAPSSDGTLHLAALEYLVDKATWDAKHRNVPHIFEHAPFDRTDAPNRFGLDAFYSQHAWVWKHNPAGLLAMWNPKVNCRFA